MRIEERKNEEIRDPSYSHRIARKTRCDAQGFIVSFPVDVKTPVCDTRTIRPGQRLDVGNVLKQRMDVDEAYEVEEYGEDVALEDVPEVEEEDAYAEDAEERLPDVLEGDAQPTDRPRVTTRYMTKYERARVLGTRALQISMNAPIMVELAGETDPLEVSYLRSAPLTRVARQDNIH